VLCVQPLIDLTTVTHSQPDIEPPTVVSSGQADVPAAETVVMTTTGTTSDDDVTSVDSQAQSTNTAGAATSSQLTGNLHSFVTL